MANLYFYEGETEGNFLKTIKGKYIDHGKIIKFNFWDQDSSQILRLIKPDKIKHIVVFFDTDSIANSDRFIMNIYRLTKVMRNKKVVLISQNTNFEEELATACGMRSNQELYKSLYGVDSKQKFKQRITNDTQLLLRLEKNNFDISVYGKSVLIFENTLKSIELTRFILGISKIII